MRVLGLFLLSDDQPFSITLNHARLCYLTLTTHIAVKGFYFERSACGASAAIRVNAGATDIEVMGPA